MLIMDELFYTFKIKFEIKIKIFTFNFTDFIFIERGEEDSNENTVDLNYGK